MQPNTKRLFIHAPNIHTGGGLKLLQGMITSAGERLAGAHLDARARMLLQVPKGIVIDFVRPTLWARLSAEWRLRNVDSSELVACPNSLPPLFSIRAKAVVLVQNRLLVDGSSLRHFPLQPRLRIFTERLWFRWCQFHATSYVVQTSSMVTLLKNVLRPDIEVAVVPFDEPSPNLSVLPLMPLKYDFMYPANGDPHKNHLRVLQAWCLLAQSGIRPSLALTIDEVAYPALYFQIAKNVQADDLKITNLGYLTQSAIRELYLASGALLFPSLVESFGLPLIEANEYDLPILAPELDYVRDIASPAETFDPLSQVSIARAVRRFMGLVEPAPRIFSTAELVTELLK